MKIKAKHKYALMGYVYLFGLICAYFLNSILCFVIFGAAAVVFVLALKKRHNSICAGVLFLGISFLIMGVCKAIIEEPNSRLAGNKYLVKGVVTECRGNDNDTMGITISGTADGKRVKFTLFTADYGVSTGDEVEFEAVFSKFNDSVDFSESDYYFSKGIFVKAYAVSDITVTGVRDSLTEHIDGLTGYFRHQVDRLFSGEGGGIIKAMFFGDKTDLSYETRADIKHSGISHLTAVSGMHLSIMVHVFAGVFALFFRKGGRVYSVIVGIYVLFLMFFFGMTASVMRSGFMMLVYYSSHLLYRKTGTVSSVGDALMVILLFNPYACRDIGLLLSAAGTLGVGAVSPMIAKHFGIKEDTVFSNAVLPSLCASACTMPIGALYFGGISFAAPITCLLVQPFFTLILLLVPWAVILGFVSEPLMFVTGWAAEMMKGIAHITGGLDISYVSVDPDVMTAFMVLVVSGAVITALVTRKIKSTAFFGVVMFLAFAASLSIESIISFDDIKISIIPNSNNPIVCVSEKTGKSFYMLSTNSKTPGVIYELLFTDKANLLCVKDETTCYEELSALSTVIHLPEDDSARYLAGEHSVIVDDTGIMLTVRGINIGILPAGSELQCDIPIYTGYKENYGKDGYIATILCHKKYYNCGEAINAFYNKTEIIINSQGEYTLCVENKGG